jgi:hypothetical protein
MPSARKQNANVRAETKGCDGIWKRQGSKDCRSLRRLLLYKAVTLSNSAETEKKPKGRLHQAPSSHTQ